MDKKLEKIFDLKLDASDRDTERHGLIQYDYGQILRIHGLDLPPAVEIQFSYREKGGVTENRIGTTKDGVTEVRIPDAMLKNNGTTQDYAIWVFIYVTDATSGNTVYRIKLYVDSRPAPGEKISEDPDEPHILDEAVNAVNAAAERAETAEAEARSAADSATAAAESARKSAEEVMQEKNTAISAIQDQQAASEKAITDHTDTEIGRLDRETQESEDRLTETIRTANDTKEAAESTISEARRVKESLDISVQNATKEKEAVEASTSTANAAKKNLDQSTADANVAKTALDKTIQSADDQNTSLGEKIKTSKQLKTDLQTAGEKATQDIHTAGEEERSQMTQIAEQFQESIDALTPDDSVVDGKAWTSKKIIDTLCPEFQETGNPVTCYPVENYPLDIVVGWKPIQEGSGNPYPAGCGPNLLDISRCVATENKPYGLHATIDKDVIKIDGVPNDEVINEGKYQFAVAYTTQTELKGKGYKVTAFAEKGIVYGAWGLRTANESQLAISARLTPGVNTDIQVRLMVSKSEPSVYYPYENIRPIHGRDNVTIKRCGENVLKTDGAEEHNKVMNGITYERLENGGIHLYGTTTGRTYYCIAKTYVKIYKPIPAGEYTFCPYCKFPDGVKIYFLVNDIASGSLFSIAPGDKVESVTRKISNNVETIDAYIVIDEAGKTVDTVVYPMLAVGSICPSAYATYTEQRICAELSEETSYGGTLNAITGMGTADWTVRTFDGTEAWNSWGVDNITKGVTGFFSYDVDDYDYAYTSDAFSSHTISNASSWGGETIGFGFANENSIRYFFVSVYNELLDNTESNEKAVESWKAYLAEQYAAGTPVQIAYKVAEPVSFRAETEQIQALKGINNILTDADTVTVTGREDPVHYVDKKFAELSAAIVASASEAE